MTADNLNKTGEIQDDRHEDGLGEGHADEPASGQTTGRAAGDERVNGLSRHALLANCFELMAEILGPFIDQRMAGYFEDEESWREAAANRLGRSNEHGDTDPLFQLLVLRRFWGPVFADYFDVDLRGIIGELIDTRNKWAHFNLPRDPDSLDRAVLAIERLISPLAPEYCGELRVTRAQLRSSPHMERLGRTVEPKPAAPEMDSTGEGSDQVPSETEVAELATQLSETESVFLDLKERYGDVVSELESSREVAAKKQMLLSALENQLVMIQTRTTAAEAILAEEQTTRYRVEWLVVGLLATLTLFLVLSNS